MPRKIKICTYIYRTREDLILVEKSI